MKQSKTKNVLNSFRIILVLLPFLLTSGPLALFLQNSFIEIPFGDVSAITWHLLEVVCH